MRTESDLLSSVCIDLSIESLPLKAGVYFGVWSRRECVKKHYMYKNYSEQKRIVDLNTCIDSFQSHKHLSHFRVDFFFVFIRIS